jgi:hypothetical protein
MAAVICSCFPDKAPEIFAYLGTIVRAERNYLPRMLSEKGYSISLRTTLRCRTALGWTFRGSAYYQLIREANKQKRFQWAQQHLGQSFEDVTWTDESTIQLKSYCRFACRKHGEAPRPKPRCMN